MTNDEIPKSSARFRRYFKELRFRQLRSLLEVARTGSFAEAAEVLQLSCPTVWQQVRALEQEFKCPLVERHGRGAKLTEDGQFLLELATPVVDGFESMKDVFRQHKRIGPLHLTVATTAQLLANELAQPLQHFREQCPEVHIRFYENPSRSSLKMLENDEVDIAITGLPSDLSLKNDLDIEPIGAYPSVLLCRRDHPLTKKSRLDVQTLIKHKLILPAPNANSRAFYDRMFIQARLMEKVDVVLESTNAAVFLMFAQMGLGVCLFTLSPLFLKRLDGKSRPYQNLYWRDVTSLFGGETIVLARRRGKHLPRHVLNFQELVRQQFQ
jgi:molybdate transport repressor ModE-like protein